MKIHQIAKSDPWSPVECGGLALLVKHAHLKTLESGAVVEVDGFPGVLFMLCRESAREPRYERDGQQRHFLVSLADGQRLVQGEKTSLYIRPVTAVLKVGEAAA